MDCECVVWWSLQKMSRTKSSCCNMGSHIPLRAVPDAGNFLRIPCVWIETWPRGHDGVLAVSRSQRVLVGAVDALDFSALWWQRLEPIWRTILLSGLIKVGNQVSKSVHQGTQWENGELIWIEHGLNSFCLGMVYISCSWRTSSHSHFKFAAMIGLNRVGVQYCSMTPHRHCPPQLYMYYSSSVLPFLWQFSQMMSPRTHPILLLLELYLMKDHHAF